MTTVTVVECIPLLHTEDATWIGRQKPALQGSMARSEWWPCGQSWPSSEGGPRLARYRSRLAPTHLNVFDRYFLPSCLLLASPPPRSDTPKSQPLMTFPLVARRSTFDLLSPEHQASIHRKWSSYSTHRESPTSSILAPSRLRLPSHRTERRLTQVT